MFSKKILGTVAAVAMTVGIVGQANAQEVTLRVSSWAPPTHGVNAEVFPTWIRELEEATNGRITGEIVYRLAPPPRQFDIIRDGAADVSWIFHGYNPGQFVATQAVELPLLGANAEAASVAYWRTYVNHMREAMDQEHEGVMIIGLMTHGPGVIQTREQIDSWDDLQGMKIRVPGGMASRLGEIFSVTAVSVPAPQVYETLSSRAADGVFMPIETQKSFRLHEVVNHVLRVPGNFYDGSFAIIMNPAKFQSLSADDQRTFMQVSGENLSRIAGAMWQSKDEEGLETARAEGSTVTDASDEMMERFREVAQQLEDEWVETIGDRFDARAAREYLQEQAENYEE